MDGMQPKDHGYLDRVFKSERSRLLKVAAAALIGLYIAFQVVAEHRNLPWGERVCLLVVLPAFFLAAASVLVRADVVRRRLRAGYAVGRVSRLLFASGVRSLLIWTIGVLLLGFPLAIWIGTLTAEQPAGF